MRNDFGIKREEKRDNKVTLFVDTKKAILRDMKWTQLGEFGKRKFENLLFLEAIGKSYVQIRYL